MVKNHNPKNEMQDMLTPLDAEEAAKTKLRLDMREIPKSSIKPEHFHLMTIIHLLIILNHLLKMKNYDTYSISKI